MGATVYGTSRFGIVNDSSATGLHLASFRSTPEVEQAFAKNHIGCDYSIALYNDGAQVECEGVVAVKATGLTIDLASTLTLSNVTADSLNTNSQNLFTTPVANAGLIVVGAPLTRTNSGFEEGSISAIYKPLIATNSSTSLT